MTDKVVVITGGSRGIGRATAIAAAARGFRVVVGYASNEAAAKDVVSEIERKNGKSRGESLWDAVDRLGKRYGKNAVSLGSQRALSLQYLGAKIAFTRVPDTEEFRE